MYIKRNRTILYLNLILLCIDVLIFVHTVHSLKNIFIDVKINENLIHAIESLDILQLTVLIISFIFLFIFSSNIVKMIRILVLERYKIIPDEGLYVIYSFAGYTKDFIPWYSITGIDMSQTLFDRIIKTGTLSITNVAVPKRMRIVIPFVKNYNSIYEIIKQHMNNNNLLNDDLDYEANYEDEVKNQG